MADPRPDRRPAALYSEFYQPLDVGSRYFVAPYLDFGSQNIEATLDNDPIAEYRLERWLWPERGPADRQQRRSAPGEAWGEAEVRIGDQDLPVSFNEGFYELKYSFDTLDNVFPTPWRRHRPDLAQVQVAGFRPGLPAMAVQPRQGHQQRPEHLRAGRPLRRTLDATEVVTSSFVLAGRGSCRASARTRCRART